MGGFLKEDTAAVIAFGPFLDKTDGVTLEVAAGIITSIDHATTGIFLSKNGGAGAIRHQAVTASTLDAYGMFLVTLDTTDTNTVGRLRVMMAEAATFLPVWDDFMVLPANVFDSLMGTDLLDVSATQWLGTAILAPGVAGTPDVNAKLIGGTAQTAGDLAAAVITNAAGTDIAADIIAVKAETAMILADTNELQVDDTPGALATLSGKVDVVDGIVDAILLDTGTDGVVVPQAQADKVWGTAARTLTAGTNIALAKGTGVTGFTDIDAAGVRTAVGLAAADLDTQLAALPTDADVNAACDTAVTDGLLATAAELAKVPKSDGTATWNATALASLQSEATDALNAYDPPTKTEMDNGFAGLNDLASGDVETAVGTALATYDPPTKTEMDSGHALLATPAQVNAEVVDALNVDTYAEPAQGAPPATASIAAKIGYGYKFQRNKLEQTDSELSIYDDAGTTVDHKATVSDDGTTFTRAEIESGP